jgi:aminocarboxymuconate-semialdehyde decarboxylase
MSSAPVVDLHSHVLPAELAGDIRHRPHHYRMAVEAGGGRERFVRDDGHSTPMYVEFEDPDAKVAAMDARGIDISVVSVTPVVFFYWLGPEAGAEVARRINDGIGAMVRARPSRLRPMGTLPLQDPAAALAELDRIVLELGFRSVELGCAIGERQLAHPDFRPILARIAKLGVFVFAHPYFAGAVRPDLTRFYLANLLGHPFDTAVMAAHLMFDGVLDELPDLRFVLAHGGGHLPYQAGRLQHGYNVRREPRDHGASAPDELLRRFHFDALTHDAAALRFLVERVGADRVVIGTDDPFDMAEPDPLAMLAAVPEIGPVELDRIRGANALALLGEMPGDG